MGPDRGIEIMPCDACEFYRVKRVEGYVHPAHTGLGQSLYMLPDEGGVCSHAQINLWETGSRVHHEVCKPRSEERRVGKEC